MAQGSNSMPDRANESTILARHIDIAGLNDDRVEAVKLFEDLNDDELVDKAVSMYGRDIYGYLIVEPASLEVLRSVLRHLVIGEAPSPPFEIAEGSAIGMTALHEVLTDRIAQNSTTEVMQVGERNG